MTCDLSRSHKVVPSAETWGIRHLYDGGAGPWTAGASAGQDARMKWHSVYVDQERRFALEVEEESGRTFLSIPVSNTLADYLEWYEVDAETFERYHADPTLAIEFAEKCKRREMDHLLLLPPGTDRGWAT